MKMTSTELLRNYEGVQAAIAESCARHGRLREDITLVAVSKFHEVGDIAAIAGAGQLDFGENYVQEAQEKQLALNSCCPDLRWHMIGHVQSRKAPQVAGNFCMIHSLDSARLANALEKSLRQSGKSQAVLIEVNIGGEAQKAGIAIEELNALGLHVAENCPHLELRGLMCLPPVFDDGTASRPYFAKLRQLKDNLRKELGMDLPHLSMGMSGDFDAAIGEGATMVRIGTSIFGPRPAKRQLA